MPQQRPTAPESCTPADRLTLTESAARYGSAEPANTSGLCWSYCFVADEAEPLGAQGGYGLTQCFADDQ